jgi:hypothetical protein
MMVKDKNPYNKKIIFVQTLVLHVPLKKIFNSLTVKKKYWTKMYFELFIVILGAKIALVTQALKAI